VPETIPDKAQVTNFCWCFFAPSQTEKAQELASCLLKKIIPQFKIPVSVGSKNGPAFVVDVIRNNLEAVHDLPSLEFRKSRTYEQDSKIAIGKTMPGDPPTMGSITAHALLRFRSSPTKWTGLSPFEILLGHPPPLV
jgi:hypothetical protein